MDGIQSLFMKKRLVGTQSPHKVTALIGTNESTGADDDGPW